MTNSVCTPSLLIYALFGASECSPLDSCTNLMTLRVASSSGYVQSVAKINFHGKVNKLERLNLRLAIFSVSPWNAVFRQAE
jgi:hypothetical protein